MNVFEGLMLILQVGAFLTSLYNQQGWKALYWAGAFVVTLAVVRGLK